MEVLADPVVFVLAADWTGEDPASAQWMHS
jgi:hypothetical protein